MFFGSVMTIFARDGIMGDGRREILPEIALGYCGWVMVVPGPAEEMTKVRLDSACVRQDLPRWTAFL